MDFKIDENLPIELTQLLRGAGHEAMTVTEQRLGGSADADIALVCQQEHRALITLDMDFADIRAYPPDRYAGLVVLRLRRQDKHHVLDMVSRLIPLFTSETLTQRLWIIDERTIRIRE